MTVSRVHSVEFSGFGRQIFAFEHRKSQTSLGSLALRKQHRETRETPVCTHITLF